jgi:hypothetical protein
VQPCISATCIAARCSALLQPLHLLFLLLPLEPSVRTSQKSEDAQNILEISKMLTK